VVEELRALVSSLERKVADAESERGHARASLQRMKEQMLHEQDDEEEKVAWRVQAEVRMLCLVLCWLNEFFRSLSQVCIQAHAVFHLARSCSLVDLFSVH
jgi:hypothetical protein